MAFFFFSSRRRHTRSLRDWSSDVCSSDLPDRWVGDAFEAPRDALDRRGSWKVKGVSGRFESIANPAVREFIGRNYAADEKGRWYFQNGPQRVYVSLDYTPWVYRLDDAGEGLLAHTGSVVSAPEAAFLDEAGAILLEPEIG